MTQGSDPLSNAQFGGDSLKNEMPLRISNWKPPSTPSIFKPKHNDRSDFFTTSDTIGTSSTKFSGLKSPNDVFQGSKAIQDNRNLRQEANPFGLVYDKTSSLSKDTLNLLNIYIDTVLEEALGDSSSGKIVAKDNVRGRGFDTYS